MFVSATYFDGQTARSSAAQVEFRAHSIEITLEDPAPAHPNHISWDVNQVMADGRFSHNHATLNYGQTFPQPSLVFAEEGIAQRIHDAYPQFGLLDNRFNFFLKRGTKGIVLASLIGIALLVLSYVYVIPQIGESVAAGLPIVVEQELGESLYERLLQGYEVNEYQSDLVQHFYDQMDYPVDYDVKIKVVDNYMVNAFVIPGGKMIIYSGILEKMETPEELAALLGHECAHIQGKHATKGLFRSLAGYMFISLLLNDMNGVGVIVVENANQLQGLRYSRKLEKEADMTGAQWMVDKNINADGMVDLFTRLEEAHGDLPESMEFLTSHPLTKDRIDYIRAFSAENSVDSEFPESLNLIWEELKSSLE